MIRRATMLGAALLATACVEGSTRPAATTATAATVPRCPTASIADDPAFAPAAAEVERWLARGAFPGAVLAVGQGGRLRELRAFGRMSVAPDAPAMPVNALFDLASLTKVIATTTAAAILVDRGKLRLDARAADYLPAFGAAPGHADITVRQLLVHASGLAPSGPPLWQQAHDRSGILSLIDHMKVEPAPGTRYTYRDENMIVLARIITRLSGEPLDRFLAQEVFGPLGMTSTGYRPPASELPRIPPTEQDDMLRHRVVRGVVHDENAYLLGGVSGNAGLFSTACDLSRFAQMMLGRGELDGRRILSAATVDLFRTRQGIPPTSQRALGWDMHGSAGGYAGTLASATSLSHTGYTGTSIYIDYQRDAFIVLLTNRVNPTRDNRLIEQARPAIMTAVLRSLDEEMTP